MFLTVSQNNRTTCRPNNVYSSHVLVVQCHILHRDISVNNTMIFVCNTAESEAKKGMDEAFSGEESKTDGEN